jgi:GT2 family glycosyltransferase
MPPRVSVVVVAYRSGPALACCLDSLERQDEELEVVVVDNGAVGDEVERAARRTRVRVVRPGGNVGFAAGCNAGAAIAAGEILLFLNPDTVVGDGAVRELADALASPEIGIAMARLRLLDEPDVLNSSGNVVHVAGFGWAGGHGERVNGAGPVTDVPYATGAALAIRADVFRGLGGFTDELFLYHEDLELGWRARMRGLRVVVVPHADVFHEYEFARNAAKRYFLERNRLVFVLSAYSGRTLAVLAPVLVGTELAMAALAAREGWLREKARGWAWLARNARWLARHRRETQALRRVADRDLARHLTPTFDPAMVAAPGVVGPLNRAVERYWALARRAL